MRDLESCFSWETTSDNSALIANESGLVVDGHALAEQMKVLVLKKIALSKSSDVTNRIVGDTVDFRSEEVGCTVSKSEELSYNHLIGCESTSLIRADDCSAAKSLHSWQFSDNSLLFSHSAVPRARQVVITAGRPSGMAATARATATLK